MINKENLFAKLFELEEGQVLLVKQYNDEEDLYEVIESTMIDGLRIDRKVSITNEDKAYSLFNEYDKGRAVGFYDNMKMTLQDQLKAMGWND